MLLSVKLHRAGMLVSNIVDTEEKRVMAYSPFLLVYSVQCTVSEGASSNLGHETWVLESGVSV